MSTEIDYDDSTRNGRAALRDEISLSWDGHDLQWSALSPLGGVCDVLCYAGESHRIPESAGYSPGMGGPELAEYPSSMFVEMYEDGSINVGDLEYWARVLDRFYDLIPEDRRY